MMLIICQQANTHKQLFVWPAALATSCLIAEAKRRPWRKLLPIKTGGNRDGRRRRKKQENRANPDNGAD